jgi:hypothetical protein
MASVPADHSRIYVAARFHRKDCNKALTAPEIESHASNGRFVLAASYNDRRVLISARLQRILNFIQ